MEYRTKRAIKLQAEGKEKPGPIESFTVELHETYQSRQERRGAYWHDHTTTGKPAHTRTTVMEGLTREGARELVDEIVGWLAYIEEGQG